MIWLDFMDVEIKYEEKVSFTLITLIKREDVND